MITNFPHGKIWAEYLSDKYANVGSESDVLCSDKFNTDEKKILKYFTQPTKFTTWLFIMNSHYQNIPITRRAIEKHTGNSQSTVLRCCNECAEAGYIINTRELSENITTYIVSEHMVALWEKYIDYRLDHILKFEMDLSIRLRRTEQTVFKKKIVK
jgi:hypothetical protein